MQFPAVLLIRVVLLGCVFVCNRDFAIERSDVDMLAAMFQGGHWRPHIDARGPFNLDQVDQAFSLSKTGTVVGKISIVP